MQNINTPFLTFITASGEIQHGGSHHFEFLLKLYLWFGLRYQVDVQIEMTVPNLLKC